MSKNNDQPDNSPVVFSDEDIGKARQWFAKGQHLAEKKNYDYAIESYIGGLGYWPEAVDEGHKPCRAAALFRGTAKVSFTDQMKYKTGGKDPKRAMLNAEMLLSKNPNSIKYMEEVFRHAAKAGYDQTVMWIGEILADAAMREAKPNPDRFILMRKIYEEVADRNVSTNTNPEMAIQAMGRAVEALDRLQTLKPQDLEVATDLRNVAGKLTILKGKYSTADSFRDSVRDSESQRDIRDKDRAYQTDERIDELLMAARRRFKEHPQDRGSINELVDLLVRRDNDKEENEAIEILLKAAEELDEYRFKMRADELSIRQLKRRYREVAARHGPKSEETRKAAIEVLRLELKVYKDRCDHYPTDMRIRYQFGHRLFQAGKYDEAIPVLQEARSEPRTRAHCNLFIGRCFYQKGYHAQAIETLLEAIRQHEPADDDLGKEMHFRLGVAYEDAGRKDDALKVYGQLIQWDYNYRNGEVRKRYDGLKGQG